MWRFGSQSFLLILISCQLAFSAHVVINRGDNANTDNDENPTTPPVPEPPIHHQFAVVSSKLSAPQKSPVLKTKLQAESNEKKVEDTDDSEADGENNAEEGDAVEERTGLGWNKRQAKQVPPFQPAVACGYHRLRPGQAYSIQSTNYNAGGTYRNFEQCTWRFFGQQCKVKAACPCFKLPSSPDCSNDLLKVTDLYSFAHKFCGDSTPQGIYASTTNNLKVHFRADSQTDDNGSGFRCYVTCTGYGQRDPTQLTTSPATCAAANV